MSDDLHPAVPLIAGFEGFRSEPYWDVNHYRVGYGSDTITKPDGTIQTVQPGMKVTQEDAMRDLQRRTNETQSDIRGSIGEDAWSKLSPQAQASLTSVAYNYGHLPYGVQTAAAAGDPGKIASAIGGLAGNNNGINANRRQTEADNVLGIGAPAGKFALSGPVSTDRPNVSGSASSSDSGASNLLSALLKQGGANRVPAYKPNDPNGALPQTKLEALIRTAAGQGTYTPPIVSKLNGLGGALSSLFGGSSQAGQGAPDQAGPAASAASAPPAPDAAPPQPPGSSASLASADPGGTSLIEGRSASAGNPTFDRNSQWASPAPNPDGSYHTQLSPRDESLFNAWVNKNNVPFDPSPTSDYDMRGYWKSGQGGTAVNQNDGQLHFPDTFKTPYHESFSNESQYATPDAPTWNDKDQLTDKQGNIVFDERAKNAALTEGRSAATLPPSASRPEPETADDMPFVNRQFATADRMPMLGISQPPAAPGPTPFIGGRGMPAMMNSSPPDPVTSGDGASPFPGNRSPSTPATGGSEPTNLSPYANAYSPDYRPQSDNMTFDIPGMLRTLFGG